MKKKLFIEYLNVINSFTHNCQLSATTEIHFNNSEPLFVGAIRFKNAVNRMIEENSSILIINIAPTKHAVIDINNIAYITF